MKKAISSATALAALGVIGAVSVNVATAAKPNEHTQSPAARMAKYQRAKRLKQQNAELNTMFSIPQPRAVTKKQRNRLNLKPLLGSARGMSSTAHSLSHDAKPSYFTRLVRGWRYKRQAKRERQQQQHRLAHIPSGTVATQTKVGTTIAVRGAADGQSAFVKTMQSAKSTLAKHANWSANQKLVKKSAAQKIAQAKMATSALEATNRAAIQESVAQSTVTSVTSVSRTTVIKPLAKSAKRATRQASKKVTASKSVSRKLATSKKESNTIISVASATHGNAVVGRSQSTVRKKDNLATVAHPGIPKSEWATYSVAERELLLKNKKHFIIALYSAPSKLKAKRFIKRSGLTGKASIYHYKSDGKAIYQVVMGEFPDASLSLIAISELPTNLQRNYPTAQIISMVQKRIRFS